MSSCSAESAGRSLGAVFHDRVGLAAATIVRKQVSERVLGHVRSRSCELQCSARGWSRKPAFPTPQGSLASNVHVDSAASR